MADGYARISYKPGVCFGQAGPGAINLATGLYEAFWTHTPVIALTGSTNLSQLYKFQYQELDEMPLFEPTTKWNVEVFQAARAGEIMRDAFMIATSGAPGPVHVNLHYDAATRETDMSEPYGDPVYSRYPAKRVRPDPEDVKAVAKVLAEGERPVIVAGGGVLISKAWNEVIHLAKTFMIPVATTLSGRGTIPDNNPLSIGVVGRYSKSTANKIVGDADVVFFIGSKAGGMATNNWDCPSEKATVIQLDIAPEVIGRNYRTLASMIGDVKLGLHDLLTTMNILMTKRISKDHYLSEVTKIMKEWDDVAASLMNSDAVPIKPHRAVKEIRTVLGEKDILVADTGQMSAWTGVLFSIRAPGRTYIRAAGTLGWSFPAAIGAKFAAEDRKVVDVTGDGGIFYHMTELETARRCEKPFVAVVFNNASLGMLHYSFAWKYGNKALKSSEFLDIDYGKIARSFGCFGMRIERPNDLNEALQAAVDSDTPAVIDVMIDKYELSPTTLYRTLPQGRPL
jgi:acetolactate synthase-1/2/3 large subunit